MIRFYVFCRNESGVEGEVTYGVTTVLKPPPVDMHYKYTRRELVELLKKPDVEVFTTVLKRRPDSKVMWDLAEGEQIELVDGYMVPYARTRANRVTADNLGELHDCVTAQFALAEVVGG